MAELVAPSVIVFVEQQLSTIKNVIIYSIIYVRSSWKQLRTEDLHSWSHFKKKNRLSHNIWLLIQCMQLLPGQQLFCLVKQLFTNRNYMINFAVF